jgi:hypothetical protein
MECLSRPELMVTRIAGPGQCANRASQNFTTGVTAAIEGKKNEVAACRFNHLRQTAAGAAARHRVWWQKVESEAAGGLASLATQDGFTVAAVFALQRGSQVGDAGALVIRRVGTSAQGQSHDNCRWHRREQKKGALRQWDTRSRATLARRGRAVR